MSQTHAERIREEIAAYAANVDIHATPDITKYWRKKYLEPDVAQVFGSANLRQVFADEFAASLLRTGRPAIVSIGAGDGSMEADIAALMLQSGAKDFRIDCLELNPHLIERGEAAAKAKGLANHIRFIEADLSTWRAADTYGAAFANHSLHHIVALEHVFDGLKRAMAPGATFIVSDMIGRNGHMRWPEVLALLEPIWAAAPPHYRYNHLMQRHEPAYINHDCSDEGFEGIRAQDIMPELLKRFSFHRYCAWGGLTDIFIDRAFGHNLSPANPEDTAFIDRLAETDRALLRLGATTPTQLIAFLRAAPGNCVTNDLDPANAIHPSLR